MSHLTERAILELRDGVPGSAESRTHLDACSECQAALLVAEDRAEEIGTALADLDETFDVETARLSVRARLGGDGRGEGPGDAEVVLNAARRLSFSWPLGRAATLLLLTAGAASALPGSPVRRWIVGPELTTEAVTQPTARAGGRVTIDAGPIEVALDGVSAGTTVEVVWVAGSAVAVYSAPGSAFSYGEGRIEATISGGPVTVELPEAILPASLTVNGNIYLRSSSAGLEISGPVREQSDDRIRFMVPGA